MSKKIVKIGENSLVEMIDNIVTEVVAVTKKKWIEENAKETKRLSEAVAKLEKQVKMLTEVKK